MFHRFQQVIIILALTTIAFFVQELPSSNLIQMILPEWPFLLVLIFSLYLRNTWGLLLAFTLGVFQDIYLGTPTMGLHAAIYVLTSFGLMINSVHFTNFSPLMQSIVVSLMVLLKVIIVTTYYSLWFSLPSHLWMLLSVPLSLIAWFVFRLFYNPSVLLPEERS